MNLGHFLKPNSFRELNPFPSIRVGDVHPVRSSVDRLAEVVETFVHSSHQRQYKDPNRSSELPDPTIELDISNLPTQVRERVLLSQRPNHFLRASELTLFTVAADSFAEDEDDDVYTDLIARRYYSVGTKYLILIDGRFINLCTDVQFKHFRLSFPELKSEKWYHVVKWYDDVVT